MKRTLSLILSAVLLVCTVSLPVSAEQISNHTVKKQEYVINGSEISHTLKSKVEEIGISVTNETIVQLTPITTENKINTGNALIITNCSGSIVTKDVLLLVTDDAVGFETTGDISTRAGSTVDFPQLSWDGRYVIHGTAVFNRYSHGYSSNYYQPIGAYFTYQKYETCTVNYIGMTYVCKGIDYSYPGFQDLGEPAVENRISVNKSNPATSHMDSTTKEYNSSRVIYTGSGGNFGQVMQFNVTVNGVSDSYDTPL